MNHSTKILHIFDDAIITNSTINLFRKLSNYDQTFAVITDDEEKWSNSFINDNSVRLLTTLPSLNKQLSQLISDFDVIFLQALSYEKAKAINNSKFNEKVFVWGLWGYELYNIFDYFNSQDYQGTNKTQKANSKIMDKIKDFYTYNVVYRKAVKRIDICLFLMKKDFELLSSSLSHKSLWMTACYQTVENIYNGQVNFAVEGNSILIGNSSTPSNKHEKIFELVQAAGIENRSIIVPLSYGDLDYRKKIVEKGEKLFREQFKPLLEFMTMSSYLKVLSSCSHVIMGHKRQQGFGSIIMMLLGGAKVFLSYDNLIYHWLKELDILIYSIEDDLQNEINNSLSSEEINHNKRILTNYLSEESVLIRLEEVLKTAIAISNSKLK